MKDTERIHSSGVLKMDDEERKKKNRLEEINNEVILLVCRGISSKRIVVSYKDGNILNEVQIKVDGNTVKVLKAIN